MSSFRVRRVAQRGQPQNPIGLQYPVLRHHHHHHHHHHHRDSRDGSSCCYDSLDLSRKVGNRNFRVETDLGPASKRRRSSYAAWNDGVDHYIPHHVPRAEMVCTSSSTSRKAACLNVVRVDVRPSCNPGHVGWEDGAAFMSRDEIERCSPSRKDGIDLHRETYLRYSYCGFLQDLGIRLDVPQTTIGTAMVLCHRFFVRRSHASHDRFLIATAALFLTGKSEETPLPLKSVLILSYEICHKQDLALFPHMLHVDWFDKYKEQVLEAEHMILTTLDFELSVQHPYNQLTSVLNKLGLSQSSLVALAWNLINEGLWSSLWLQFKPHHIAAGAAVLAAKILNLDLSYYPSMWQEFQTTPTIAYDIVQQLMELF